MFSGFIHPKIGLHNDMEFRIASWNINSVRLRIGQVTRFLETWQPDVLCLQETKCPQGQFPDKQLQAIGYSHIAEKGQSGYHGVAIISKWPLLDQFSRQFCNKQDARHICVKLDCPQNINLHSFYVPAGGDTADREINEKFAHKLDFLTEMENWLDKGTISEMGPSILAGDLNIAPHENDVWSHKQLLPVVSHTPIEVEHLKRVQSAGNWTDILGERARAGEYPFTWWSYRARDWKASNRGRRLDHIWLDEKLAKFINGSDIVTQTRSWEKPSDHVPVIVTLKL